MREIIYNGKSYKILTELAKEYIGNDDIKSWATRDDVKIGDVGYFFNNLWDFVEDKVQKGKIYDIKMLNSDCFFTDENTSFAFFLPEDKVYMI